MLARILCLAVGVAGVAAKSDCGDLQEQLVETQKALSVAESKLAALEDGCECSSGNVLTLSSFTGLLYNTYALQKSIVGAAYAAVIKPHHEEMVAEHLETAKLKAADTSEVVKLKVVDLYNEHLDKHYQKHAAAHVDKVSAVVTDQIENAQNLYALHADQHVETLKEKVYVGATDGYAGLKAGLAEGGAKVQAVLEPKVDALVGLFPEHSHVIPDALSDRVFFLAAFLLLSILYIVVFAKVSGKVLCISSRILIWKAKLVWFLGTLPVRTISCNYCCCKKRASKQTFSKPSKAPVANGNGSSKKAHKKK